jgi:hypothetical protein
MIQFHCPTCGMNHTAPDASAGQNFTCQVCSQVVRIPDPEPTRPLPKPALTDPPRTSRPEPRDDRDRDRDLEPRRSRPVLSNDRDQDRDPYDRDYDDRDYRDRDDRDRGRSYRRSRDDYDRDFRPRRNFTESAVLVLVMYWLFYPVGAILNFVYLSEARAVVRDTGRQPEGRGCLLALLVVCFWVPLALGLIFVAGCIAVTAIAPSNSFRPVGVQTGVTPKPKFIPQPGSMGNLPVTVSFNNRRLILRNTTNRSLTVTVLAENKPLNQQWTYVAELDPFATEELGTEDGWSFERREKVTVSHPEYDTLVVDVP